jgi:MoaA/NifB/PqqE/SkfB family radical SAM enzyme
LLRHLQVETTNICNSHCIFCPHDEIKEQGTITDTLWEKIIRDAAKYNPLSLAPVGTGEPFCDPDLIERLKFARSLMPDTKLIIFSNGSLITESDIDDLEKLGKVNMSISLNGGNKETRYKLMGLDDYKEVRAKIDVMRAKGIDTHITVVWFPTLTLGEIDACAKIEGFTAIQFQSYAGQMYHFKRHKPTRCERVTDYLTVWHTGQAVLCCFDHLGKVNFGDLNYQTIGEIWENKAHYLKAHELYAGQTMNLCQSCTEAP